MSKKPRIVETDGKSHTGNYVRGGYGAEPQSRSAVPEGRYQVRGSTWTYLLDGDTPSNKHVYIRVRKNK